MIDPAPIRPRGHHARGEQRLDLRGEEQPVALPRPIERADAEAVAPEQELASACHPRARWQTARAVAPTCPRRCSSHMCGMISVSQCLTNRCPRASSSRALLEMIEKLAVENDGDIPVLIGDRLLPIRQADDAQPPRSQREPGRQRKPSSSGPRCNERAGHSPDDFSGHGPLPGEINNSCDAAHDD